jgi:hypothetical protein
VEVAARDRAIEAETEVNEPELKILVMRGKFHFMVTVFKCGNLDVGRLELTLTRLTSEQLRVAMQN